MRINIVSHSRQVYGIDFSGAKDASKKIWISRAVHEYGSLQIKECYSLSEKLNPSSKSRDLCHSYIRSLIEKAENAIFGLDLPFGLPALMLDNENWPAFIDGFAQRYPSPETFRDQCRKAAGNKELKRKTDRESKAPFSPYNLWIYKQTYYGIYNILRPLLLEKKANFPPMQQPENDLAWVIETGPACTLKRLGLYIPYKGKEDRRRQNRELIATSLSEWNIKASKQIIAKAIEDSQGDALDSIIAAYATARALEHISNPDWNPPEIYRLEGLIFD